MDIKFNFSGMNVYDTFEHFWKTSVYNYVVLLLLMSLKEKDELGDLNSQLKCHINDHVP